MRDPWLCLLLSVPAIQRGYTVKNKSESFPHPAGNSSARSTQRISRVRISVHDLPIQKPATTARAVEPLTKSVYALEHVRRMGGGSQPHLMRCSDGFYYVVKFQNNPQHSRTLVNELLGTLLAGWMGLPIAPFAVVDVGRDLIRSTEELVMKVGNSLTPCREGLQFGSRYVCDPQESTVHSYLDDEQLKGIENISDFLGMLVFDKWTCNTDIRQTVFYKENDHTGFLTRMIDQGYCFNAGEWDFRDRSFIGLFPQQSVYRFVRGLDSFGQWLEVLEDRITITWLRNAAMQIPSAWYDSNMQALDGLIAQLDRRRMSVRKLIEEAKADFRRPFPNWT